MKRRLMSFSLVVALITCDAVVAAPIAAVHPKIASSAAMVVSDPAAQIYDMARLFRAGDVSGLVHGLVPPSKWEEVRLAYELQQLQPISDVQRAEFQEKIARLTSVGAVDHLMAEIEPKLDEARPQLSGALLMGFAATQMAIHSSDGDLTNEQRASLAAAFPSIQNWARSTDFLSPKTMRQALTLLTDAARATGITDLDQFRALPLDDLLFRAAPLLSAAKDAARLYGVDLDAIVDSLQVNVIKIEGDKAIVRTTVNVFDAPLTSDQELVLIDGRWYFNEAAQRPKKDS